MQTSLADKISSFAEYVELFHWLRLCLSAEVKEYLNQSVIATVIVKINSAPFCGRRSSKKCPLK